MRFIKRFFAFVTLMFLPSAAYAQHELQEIPDPAVDPNGFVGQLFESMQDHRWPFSAALLLVGAVAALRWYAAKKQTTPLGVFLSSKRGGSLLAIVGGIIGAIATGLAAHAGLSPKLIVSGVMTGVLASGGWNVVWDIFFPTDMASKTPSAIAAKQIVPANTLPPPPMTALLPFLLGALLLSACGYCMQQAHKKEARCQAEDVVVNCGAPQVIKLVTSLVVPAIESALAGGDWAGSMDSVADALRAQGVSNAIDLIRCAIAQLRTTNPVVTGHSREWLQLHPPVAARPASP